MRGLMPHPCGQCMPCRIKRRRLWTNRLLLECLSHTYFSFVTLTYDEGSIPAGGSLKKEDYQRWLKRMRERLDPIKLRYFIVGEYGEQSWRPHYHVALFGMDCTDPVGRVNRQSVGKQHECVCWFCSIVRDSWDMGRISVDALEPESAQYICGYVTKKLTTPDSPLNKKYREEKGLLLGDRIPEFAQPSLKPGIGALSADAICEILTSDFGCDSMASVGDVPTYLKQNKKMLILGRYLRGKIRETLGFPEPKKSTPEAYQKWVAQVHEVYKRALEDPENPTGSVKKQFQLENEQKMRDAEARALIYRKVGSLR